MKLSGLLIILLLGSLIGTLVLRAVLWPAFAMAGAPKGKPLRLVTGCFLMSLAWIVGTAGWQWSMIPVSSSLRSGAQGVFLAQGSLGVLSFLGGGALAGVVAARTAPLPGVFGTSTLAGGAVGLIFTLPMIFPGRWAGAGLVLPLLFQIAWFGFPVAAVYRAASVQKRRIVRFRKGRCVKCDYPAMAIHPRCNECGVKPWHLCAKCRHVVDARPGEACPKCKAEIARVCWKCGYDWAGLDSEKCPECGVWKPVVQPPTNPAPENPA